MSAEEPTAPLIGWTAAPGSVLGGRYELLAAVGRGGMADVWKARDQLLDRTVAIKLFRCGTGHDARRKAEAVALASLSHPGLVTVFDAVLPENDTRLPENDTSDPSYLVTEYVDGPTLRAQLDSTGGGRLAVTDTALLGGQLADALGYVHASGIVHRDVKPANVLLGSGVGPGSQAKLADFGVALLAGGERLTQDGSVIGTANYLSPEQLTGAQVGPPSDVYSLGLVLLECLTGEMVYPGSGIEAALARLHRPPSIPSQLPEALQRLLAAMLTGMPSDRPGAGAVTRQLHEFGNARGSELAADPAEPTVLLPGSPRPRPTENQPRPAENRPRPAENRPRPAENRPRPGQNGARSAGAWWRRWWWLPVGVGAVVVVAIVLSLTLPGGGSPSHPAAPQYPSVSGRLGHDLGTLQRDVQP
jgi:serine/threonine protein kinase